ncbi:MAG: sigma-70 factor domain-containing protein, partial [Acidimicrobiales bacterium]
MATREDHDSSEDLLHVYLNEIGSHELLTKADEQRLGTAIETGRAAAAELAGKGPMSAHRKRE